MRILFISAFYPPYEIGGWEQLVQDINLRLQARAHTTLVLTSTHGLEGGRPEEPGVSRRFSLESGLVSYSPLDTFRSHTRRLEQNRQIVRETVAAFRPEVIFIHGMWNLNPAVAWEAEQACPGRVVYYLANDWPYAPSVHRSYWEEPARSPGRRLFKKLLAPLALRRLAGEEKRFRPRFDRVLCVSQAVCQALHEKAGIPRANMRVVYNGVEVERFTPRPKPSNGGLDLLYAGSLVPHKGVHTAVEAMALLAGRDAGERLTLTIVGSGHPQYEAGLRRMAGPLQGRVAFRPRVPREEMPELMGEFDALVFPSIWEEPLARMVQEAMASGLVVVGTPTGGTPEALQEGRTGLTFPPGDAAALADQLERLASDPGLRHSLSRQARRLVEEKFDLQRMVDEIEAELLAFS